MQIYKNVEKAKKIYIPPIDGINLFKNTEILKIFEFETQSPISCKHSWSACVHIWYKRSKLLWKSSAFKKNIPRKIIWNLP